MKPLDVEVTSLKPHPENSRLYNEFDPSKDDPEFVASIRDKGLLEPLRINPDLVVLSGHRRLKVLKHIGAKTAPCLMLEASDLEGKDERELIVEYNRYRVKTISERMREVELLEEVVRERGRKAMGDHSTSGHDSRAILAEAVGMKPRTFDKAATIYKLAKVNENAKLVLEKLDAGELSIDSAFKAVRKLSGEKEKEELPDFIRLYNVLTFTEIDPRFGIPHPGQIPGQIAGNIIYYFTEEGELVLDPMAGGGSTLDVAEFLGRRALGFDIAPRRPDIQKHDISKGFPSLEEPPKLIFLDPPYWNMVEEYYVAESASSLDLESFIQWYRQLIHGAAQCVDKGGFVSLIILSQYWRLPEGFEAGYIDWPFMAYQFMQEAGLIPWTRIHSSIPASTYTAFDVEKAKRDKYMLPIARDIVVMRKPYR